MFEPNCLIIVMSPEISLKSKRVQERMRTILKKNIINSLEKNSVSYGDIHYRSGRFFLYVDELEKTIAILKNCFGIFSLIKAQKEKISSIKEIEEFSLKVSKNNINGEFAVRCKSFNKELKRSEVEIKVGSKLMNHISNLKVNLSNPKTQLNILLFDKKTFFYFEEIKTIIGMPVGTQGFVAVLAKNKEMVYNLLKCGCVVILLNGSKDFKEMEKYNSFKSFQKINFDEAIEKYNKKIILAFFTDSNSEKEIKKLNNIFPVKVFAPYLLA